MATFYIPERVTVEIGITIAPLESFGGRRWDEILQSANFTPANVANIHTLNPDTVTWLDIPIRNLTIVNKAILVDFINNKAIFRKNLFDFTDDLGEEYDNCRLWNTPRFKLSNVGLFDTDLLIRSEGRE